MAIGKNKKLSKGKKGGKKKSYDPMSKKEWFQFKAPAPFQVRTFGHTPVTKSSGTRIATDYLKGRVLEVSLADLNKDSDNFAWRKIKLIVEDVEGRNCLTNFYGMDMTRDKLFYLIKKWQSLIEAHCEVKTLDGYVLRLFCIGFTEKGATQKKKTSYAQSSQIKAIRKKMVDIMTKTASGVNLQQLVEKFVSGDIGEDIKKACKFIYPLSSVNIRKVKMLKKAKFDSSKINEMYVEKPEEEKGTKTQAPEEGTKNLLTA